MRFTHFGSIIYMYSINKTWSYTRNKETVIFDLGKWSEYVWHCRGFGKTQDINYMR